MLPYPSATRLSITVMLSYPNDTRLSMAAMLPYPNATRLAMAVILPYPYATRLSMAVMQSRVKSTPVATIEVFKLESIHSITSKPILCDI